MNTTRDNGKKPATIRADKSRIGVHIKPKLGKLKVAAVTSYHVEDFMRGLSAGSKSRTVGLLGAIFSYAMKRKMRPETHALASKSQHKRRALGD